MTVRYARLRRRLLVDPPKDGSSSPDLAMDNPLSQNPGKSMAPSKNVCVLTSLFHLFIEVSDYC